MTEVHAFNLLLVEDEPGDALLVRQALADSRIVSKCRHVTDGQAAVEFLEDEGDGPARPDLILLDLNMPRMDGREFLAWLRANSKFRNLPVVVLTTSTVERDVEQSYGLGANSFITKPVDVDQLFEAVRAVSEYWFSVVRLPQGADRP